MSERIGTPKYIESQTIGYVHFTHTYSLAEVKRARNTCKVPTVLDTMYTMFISWNLLDILAPRAYPLRHRVLLDRAIMESHAESRRVQKTIDALDRAGIKHNL